MKKLIPLLSILFLTLIIFVGCGASDENAAKKVAENFVKNFYTIDSKKITKYNTLLQAENGQLSTATDSAGIAKLMKYENSIHSLSTENIKPLMTEKEYKTLIMNREDIMNIQGCAKNNFTMQVTSFNLTKASNDNESNTVSYSYKTYLKFISLKDKSTHSDVIEGFLGISKENGQWKISIFQTTVGSDLLK
jgi:hypothetical protein